MSIPSEQRRLAAIMFTDMVGYTALSQRNEPLALELLEEHRRILRSIFPPFNGTEIKTIGDGFLVEFQSALEAAQCALEIQRTLAKRNHDVSREHRIELRIGIHVGDVVHREGDVYGDGVNIASRIQPVAGIGGICISVDVERQIHHALEARFEKLAPTELKNVQVSMDLFRIVLPWERDARLKPERREPELRERRAIPLAWIWAAVFLLIVIAGWFFIGRYTAQRASSAESGRPTAMAGSLPEKSIAVLPFDNLSRDPDNAFFAEGVQDEILTRLAKVADLKVIARTSTQRFKSTPSDLRDVAKQLGVANILEGSVQKVNDQVRVNVQLINAMTNAHLWAEIYDRKLTDIFAVESDISKTIADTLQAKLTGSEKQLMASQSTSDIAAYELYHKGRSLWERRSGDNIPKAIAFYQQAIARDPNYALAYAGLANSYALLPFYTGADRREAFPKEKEAALKALRLDPKLADAHLALGKVLFISEIDIAGAMREYHRAIELKPNDATAHHWYGNDSLAALGRFEEATAEVKRAVELDPLSPVINADLGWTFYYAHRYEESAAQLRKTLEIDPTFFYAHCNLGMVLQVTGDLSGAIAEYEKAKQLNDDPYMSTLYAAAKAQAGDKGAALRMLSELDKISQHREVLGYWRALLYLSLNNKEEALRWLEQSFEQRDGSYINWIKVDPLLDSLHGDPRFEALVQKIVAPKKTTLP
jgi:adenylate cyclase